MSQRKWIFVDVDVQHDFCEPEGALYVPGSPNDAFRRLTQAALDKKIPILGSVDSHAHDAWEFASNENRGPQGEKPNFPDHCVKGTPGWLKTRGTLPKRFRFVPNVEEAPIEFVIRELKGHHTQGVYFEKEVYSLFANPLAERFVKAMNEAMDGAEFFVYGVATDYCVKAAAMGLLERGYKTALVTDAIAGITEEGVSQAFAQMKEMGARFTTLAELLEGQDR